MELADSIAGDAHKLLNVPYDCGFFISKHQNTSHLVFHNPNAAYLDVGGAGRDGIASPLNSGLENSRRFRGLPVYATLAAYGCEGYRNMLERQVQLARAVAGWLDQHEMFEILPKQVGPKSKQDDIFIIVLFRAKDEQLNRELVGRINATSKIYVSGTSWEGLPASRIAVSNWQVSVERDLDRIKTALVDVICQWQKSRSNTKPE
jgi:glutamate/tyrosine decarboxylase-like PLP-dependent enzyme